jgi:hypothetical protein
MSSPNPGDQQGREPNATNSISGCVRTAGDYFHGELLGERLLALGAEVLDAAEDVELGPVPDVAAQNFVLDGVVAAGRFVASVAADARDVDSVTLCSSKKSSSTMFRVNFQVTCLTPLSQKSRRNPVGSSGQAHPGQSKPHRVVHHEHRTDPSIATPDFSSAAPTLLAAPQPAAGWWYS